MKHAICCSEKKISAEMKFIECVNNSRFDMHIDKKHPRSLTENNSGKKTEPNASIRP